ncbi:MAG TPA: hypothetical protein VMJ92_00980 [Candidatus Limnocylindrales bacterium]|nr:hypothetical protein [Candidatus Limnocylindrales bacterium]
MERARFTADGRERSLLFVRLARGRDVEVQLLPFLARKTAHVPAVFARGVPPPAVPAPLWVLVEDVWDAPSACGADPGAIVAAKVAIERAVARDAPALRALGVATLPPEEIAERIAAVDPEAGARAREAAARLSGWPAALAHGDLRCGSARETERGVVLVGWERAHVGCALLDAVRLAADLVARGDAVLGIGLPRRYAEGVGRELGTDVLRGAEVLDRLSRRHLEGGVPGIWAR